jgi:signal transduction histidine kinase
LYARDDAHVQLEIADNGCGFIPATGGVGSALVRSFADNLQAKLQVLSNPGGGTRVMLSFPLESVPLSETGTTSEGLPRGGCALE